MMFGIGILVGIGITLFFMLGGRVVVKKFFNKVSDDITD
jgi:hypothetical protein